MKMAVVRALISYDRVAVRQPYLLLQTVIW